MTAGLLTSLEQAKGSYGDGCAEAKLQLLRQLDRSRLRSSRAVLRLHEILCFLRAYPDDARVLTQTERMLANFHRRADLRRHRAALADTGIAGTAIHYRFFWPSARWLARRWPRALVLDRRDKEAEEKLAGALPLLVTPAEAAWLKEGGMRAYAALDRLRAQDETDAVFLVRRVEAMAGDEATREAFFDSIDASCVLKAGRDTPSRSREKYPHVHIAYRKNPLRHSRPDLREEIALAPRAIRELSSREAVAVLDLARGAMVQRERDLDAFSYGDSRDVRMAEDGGGLSFVLNGVVPERRAWLSALYGYLILQNGVIVGYGDLILSGRSAAVAFNTFETFRGGEAAWNLARLFAAMHHAFGTESFSLAPYQIGRDNEEAIATGAWWFYFKLGFRPRAEEARRVVGIELARAKANSAYRSDRATLKKLAAWTLYLELDPSRPAPEVPLAEIGMRVAQALAARAGADRERAVRECIREAMRLTGLRSLQGFTPEERLAWTRWSPVVVALSGLPRWSKAERRALVRVIRAKGGRRESDFVALFAAHPKLEQALIETG